MDARRAFGVLILSLLLGTLTAFSGESIGTPELPLMKTRHQWALSAKSFRLDTGEELALYGVARRRPLGAGWYWGEAGYGALVGKRGGYFEGGASIGWQRVIADAWVLDARLFTGAGGGGNMPEGGGWLAQPVFAAGWQWSPRLQTVVEAGYARYLNGEARGWTGSFALHTGFWDLQ